MPETKKPMHPLNLPPTGTPGNGDSIKPKVLGKGGKSFSSEKFSLPSPIFHFYFPINPAISSRRTRAAASAAMRSSSF